MNRPRSISAWDLLQREQQRKNECPLLIEASSDIEWLQLHPGLYELAGPAGSGKSQMALHLCLRLAADTDQSQKAEGNHESFLSKESLKSENTRQQVMETQTDYPRAAYVSLGGTSKWKKVMQRLSDMAGGNVTLLRRIATRSVLNQDDWFNDVLNVQLPNLLRQSGGHIRVVVVDALADLYRACNEQACDRAAQLCKMAQRMKQFAMEHNTTILVLNQVSGKDEHPALGLAWAHCCNASFGTMQKYNYQYQYEGVGTAPGKSGDDYDVDDRPRNSNCNNNSAAAQEHKRARHRKRTLSMRKSPRYGNGQKSQIDFWIDRVGVHAVLVS